MSISPADSAVSPAQSLCLACGLCCDGTLFDWARLHPADDDASLSAANIVPIMEKGQRRFTLPCQHHQNRCCVIYAGWRPKICGAYECKLLKQVGHGTLSQEQALAIIERTLSHKAEVKAHLLALAGTAEQGLRELFRTVKNVTPNSPSPSSANQRARALLNFVALQVQLDRYFRDQKPVKTTT